MHMTGIDDGRPARIVTTAGVQVECDAAVVATNTPVIDRLLIHTKQAAYRTYVIACRVPQGEVADYLLWDTLDPYHYLRLQRADADTDWLIVGGEDHKTGQPDDETLDEAPFERLLAWTRERYPAAGAPEFRWSGQVLEPHDGLAFIGRNPMDASNVFVATGDSGNGLTHGTIAGMLLADLVTGRENPWATLYDPSRKSMLTAGTFLRENLNFASQYRDFATPGEVDDPAMIEPGQGALLRRGATKHALYRDKRGTLHELSAICPHLGCLVHWNGVEKTWDCPCHGSRFAAEDGHVLNGPANRGLTVIESFRAAG
jgi:Rieske Fe-S protein